MDLTFHTDSTKKTHKTALQRLNLTFHDFALLVKQVCRACGSSSAVVVVPAAPDVARGGLGEQALLLQAEPVEEGGPEGQQVSR